MISARLAKKSGFTLLALCAHLVLLGAMVYGTTVKQPEVLAPPVILLASVVAHATPEPAQVVHAPKRVATIRPQAPSPAQPASTSAIGDVLAHAQETPPTPSLVPVSTASLPTEAAPPAIERPAPPVAPRPVNVTQPSSDASYLRNPAPPYPRISKQQGEFGVVVLRVLVSAGGEAQEVHIATSSNYERLDQSAQETVKRWRFIPGSRDGVPTAMWFRVPVNFVLE